MDVSHLFEPYNSIVSKADYAFRRMKGEFPGSVRCELHCVDCCHAVFGLFLVEAVFLKHDFDQLEETERRAALERCREAEWEMRRLEKTIESFQDDPHMMTYALGKARIRCPLLGDQGACILYPYRPITCRVYGIPTMVQGVPRVCGKSGFEKARSYPVFNLDGVHRELYQLSGEVLKSGDTKDPERASLLFSVSKVITTPVEALIAGDPAASDAVA